MRGPDYRAFKAKFPPRIGDDDKPNERDTFFGFNTETAFEPLIRMSIIDPDIDDARWERLMESLTARQFDNLGSAAWLLNSGDIDIPFSRAASRLNRLSDEESKPPIG
jgi:hypothetical protein